MKKLLGVIFLLLGFSSSSNAGVYCKYLSSCSEACYYYNQGYYRLDRDRDGIPCENLCSSPCNASHKAKPKRNNKIHKPKRYYTKTKHTTHRAKSTKSNKIHHKERYYQEAFCKKVLGIMEYRIKDGTRIDCYTSTYSFEVDFGHKAYEALGQAMQYSAVENNKPGIALILETAKDRRYANRIKATAKRYGIRIFTIDKNLKVKVLK